MRFLFSFLSPHIILCSLMQKAFHGLVVSILPHIACLSWWLFSGAFHRRLSVLHPYIDDLRLIVIELIR